MPTRLHAASSAELVGRGVEVRALRALVEGAGSGRGSVVLVGGEPGIGKTRLAQETADRATATGMRSLWGSCWPGEGAPSFWPWIQVLRAFARDPDAVALLTGTAQAGDLARLVPDVFPEPVEPSAQALDPDQERFRQFDSLAAVLRAGGDARPMVVVLEDLHWADRSTLAFLDFLAREIRDARVLVVGTFREAEAGPDHPLTRLPHDVRRMSLAGLSASETGELMALVAGEDVAAPVVEATHRRTGGNPFYIREIARFLQGSGGPAEIPPTVRAALQVSLDRLSDAALRAMTVAAVAGPEFEAGVVASVIGTDPSAARALLDEAVAAHVAMEQQRLVGRYGFAHALIREALLDSLGPAERAELHGRVGDATLAAAGANSEAVAARLAHHFQSGRPEDRGKAVEHSIVAGRRALGQLLYAEALEHFGRALELTDDDDRRLDLLLVLGDAAVRAGEWPRATEAFTAAAGLARELSRPEDLARAALGLGAGLGGFEVRLFDQRQIDLLEEALAALPAGDSTLRAWVTARLAVALSFVGSVERRAELAEEGVTMARRVGDPAALAYALSTYCDANATPEHLDARLAAAREMVNLARQADDRELELLAHRFLVEFLFQAGDIRGLDVEIETYARLAEVLRQPISQWYVPLFRGARALLEGRFADSERLAMQALEMGERAHSQNARMMADFTQLTEAFRQAGRFDDLAEQYRRFVEAFPEMASVADWIAFALATVGEGDQAKARADIERLAVSGMLTGLGAGGMWIVMTGFMAEVAAEVRSVPAAEVLYEALLPFGPQFVICGTAGASYGSVWRLLGLLAGVLGRTDEAEAHFERAVEAHRAAGALPYLAHSQRELAALLLGRDGPGDRDRARSLLAEAADTYRRLLMTPWLERALAMTEPAATPNAFRRDGDVWTVRFGGRSVNVRHAKGLGDIAHLLARPGTEIHCTELIAAGEGHGAGHVPEAGLSTGAGGGLQILDEQARLAFRGRIRELQEEIDEAESAHDSDRAARAREEMDAIGAELAAAFGLGGRSRRAADPVERARKAVAMRIRAAVARLSSANEDLGRHLEHSIHTGTFCSYRPETPVAWDL